MYLLCRQHILQTVGRQLNLGTYVPLMQEQESVLRLCVAVAKSGNVDACKFGASCRFTHDIDAYLAQVLFHWPFLIWSSP